MPKVLKCSDVMPGCDAVIEGKDVDDVMAKAAVHAKKAHNIVAVSPALAEKLEQAIRDK